LLGGGGTKALSDFSGTISWDATNNQLKVTNVAGTSSNITIAQATSATKLGTATVGSTSLPIYLNSGTATAVTASSLFSSLTNSGNNISITIAG
jgi:hypothetical protein